MVAERLGADGWRVLVHGRDRGRGERVVNDIKAAGGAAEFLQADLSSMAEVRRLADAVQQATNRLDLLVNNAGIGRGEPEGRRELSPDGFELRFAVNYLSGFLLTYLLLPLLKKSAPSRIVNVSSLGQQAIDFKDVMMTNDYSGMRAYRQSKLAANSVHRRSGARARWKRRDSQRPASGDVHEHQHGAAVRNADDHR